VFHQLRLNERLRAFAGEARGGVAVPFALTLIPITFLSFAALDFHRATMIKTGLQDALDSAALAVGRSTLTDSTRIQQLGSATLAANLKNYPDTHLESASFVLNGQTVAAAAQLSVSPLVPDVFNGSDLKVTASTEVVRGINKLEIAMVLDNTGSMAGTKLSLLKTAASNFVDTLSQAAARSADPNAVKIALTPFSMTVNVGSQYRTASWIDQTGSSPINDQIFSSHVNRFTLLQQMGLNWAGCVESRQAPYDVQDTAPSTGASLFTPYFAPDEPGSSSSSTAWNNMTWYNSYLNDVTTSSSWSARQGYVAKYNTHSFLRTGTNTTTGYAYGPNAGCALQPVVRLTNNWSGLKSAINGMTAVGDTYIPMGLMWGWHMLSPNAPFADGAAYGTPQTTKVVVLMTDGQNQNSSNSNSNASFYSGAGYVWQGRLGITSGTQAQRQAAIDQRLTTLCANMKAQGIVIYTVRVEVNDNLYQVLQNCASSPDKFYDVQSASQLNQVFDAIAGAIQNLRLSK
jgi:Flp pilus assembly protein TadG